MIFLSLPETTKRKTMNRNKVELSKAASRTKKLVVFTMLLGFFISAQAISPYFLIGNLSGDIGSIELKVEEALQSEGFEILGKYKPGNNTNFSVIVYTSDELKSLCQKAGGRSMLASALKVGIRKNAGKVEVSILNPEYLFYAYLRDRMESTGVKSGMLKVSEKAKSAMKQIGTGMEPFGGDIEKKELVKYKYMMGMPKFEDAVLLNEFSSFSDAVSTIAKNLQAEKGNTVKVFEIIDKENQTAVFGVGLLDPDKGEAHFLSIIGEKHIAGMPYEIIVRGKKATILHGRYRFASHWPELTMGTFTKIMSSPGDVEDFLEALTE
jgi:hypothetical protein